METAKNTSSYIYEYSKINHKKFKNYLYFITFYPDFSVRDLKILLNYRV